MANSVGSYNIRPSKKFKPNEVKLKLVKILQEQYGEVKYEADTVESWSQETCNGIHNTLQGLNLENYKFIVNVLIGEQRGTGIKMECNAFWDPDTDSVLTVDFTSDQIYCVAVVFAIYYY